MVVIVVRSYNCTPFLHSLLTKGRIRGSIRLRLETEAGRPLTKPIEALTLSVQVFV